MWISGQIGNCGACHLHLSCSRLWWYKSHLRSSGCQLCLSIGVSKSVRTPRTPSHPAKLIATHRNKYSRAPIRSENLHSLNKDHENLYLQARPLQLMVPNYDKWVAPAGKPLEDGSNQTFHCIQQA